MTTGDLPCGQVTISRVNRPVWSMRLTSELSRLGVDRRTLDRRLRLGELVKVRRGAYRHPHRLSPEATHLEVLRATIAQTATPVVASHVSAGVVHGLPIDRRRLNQVHLLHSGTNRSWTRGGVVRRTRPEVDATHIGDIPVTTLPSTTLDLLRLLSFADAVAVADHALRRQVDGEGLLATIDAQPGRRGNGTARNALCFADPLSESAGESHTRVRIAEAGLPAPVLQLELVDREGVMRPDFAWPRQRLLAEFDGRVKYTRGANGDGNLEQIHIAEKERERRLRRLGWWVVRVVWDDLRSPERLAAVIREGFEDARPLAERARR